MAASSGVCPYPVLHPPVTRSRAREADVGIDVLLPLTAIVRDSGDGSGTVMARDTGDGATS